MARDVKPKFHLSRPSQPGAISPLVFSFRVAEDVDPSDLKTQTKRVVSYTAEAHPELVKLMEAFDRPHPDPNRRGERARVNRTGSVSFAHGHLAFPDNDPTFRTILLLHPNRVFRREDVVPGRTGRIPDDLDVRLRPLGTHIQNLGMRIRWEHPRCQQLYAAGRVNATLRADTDSLVVISDSDTRRSFRVVTNPNFFRPLEEELPVEFRVPLHLVLLDRIVDTKPLLPIEAITVAELLHDAGVTVKFDNPLAEIRRCARRHIVAYPASGRPAQAQVTFPRERAGELEGTHLLSSPNGSVLLAREDADRLVDLLRNSDADWYVDPQVLDVVRMAGASPFEDARLRDYQQQAVGMHLATEFGFVNALEPGMGKTITTLTAMAERARRIERYRALVVCEANVRSQWVAEALLWFPDAEVVQISAAADADKLAAALKLDRPVLAVISYDLAKSVLSVEASPAADDSNGTTPAPQPAPLPERGQLELFTFDLEGVAFGPEPAEGDAEAASTLGGLLDGTFWHDIAADEAALLKNRASARSKALWRLRRNSGVAVALTGTPITRNGVDDLANLICWVRGDEHLFARHRLSRQFDVANDDDLRELHKAIGPLLFRRNKSDIAAELPPLDHVVVPLTPTAAELTVAETARSHLRAAYEEMLALLEMSEQDGTTSPEEAAELRAQLQACRSQLLGSITVARLATADAEAVLESSSAAAELLKQSGLVDAAVTSGLTKRRWVASFCCEAAERGDQVLVFTEFASVARRLVAALEDAGLRVGEVLGGGGVRRDRDIAAFRAGELDVLVATSAGKRGLNLQTAAAVVHFDLPWTPDDVAQRTARVERIGAAAETVQVLYPIMQGTIEERVISLLTTRAAEAVRALDASRGADASGTDMGRIFGALADHVDTAELSTRDASLLEVTRAMVAA